MPRNTTKNQIQHSLIQKPSQPLLKSQIEILLNENQINNRNYDLQSCNDDQVSSSKKTKDDKDFDEIRDNDEDKERKDTKGEATNSNCPELYNRPENDPDSDSDSVSDDKNKEGYEDNDQTST